LDPAMVVIALTLAIIIQFWQWPSVQGTGTSSGPFPSNSGSERCPCLDESLDLPRAPGADDNRVLFTPPGSGESYYWPATYGLSSCSAHDQDLAPYCHQVDSPDWCVDRWCYIDITQCDSVYQRSAFFPGVDDLYFSYATCGVSSSFDGLAPDASYSRLLLNTVQNYLSSSRIAIEENVLTLDAQPTAPCPHTNEMCYDCVGCEAVPAWGRWNVAFSDVGFWLNPEELHSNSQQGFEASCIASEIRSTYNKVAAAEGDSTRVGYQYFADQNTGSYVQWPHTDWCPSSGYDPRRRPWFASGATGPKDIVIVVDVSGSMANTLGASSNVRRADVAQEAAIALLDTLTWADYFSIVLFSHWTQVYSWNLVQATNENLNDARAWLQRQSWMDGGTDFREAFEAAVRQLRNSLQDGTTSTCNRILLFLTDGFPTSWEDADDRWLQENADDLGMVIFTYGLSSAHDATVIKQIACNNKGVYYSISDEVAGSALAAAMTSYYEYFAAGQTKCGASYLRYIFDNDYLYAGCLPLYNRNGSEPELLGVSCMDLSMFVDWNELLNSFDAREEVVCQMSSSAKKCLPLELTECHLEKLRMNMDFAEQCQSGITLPASCDCVEPTCQDDDTFVDELGYFCDSWVGDKCEEGIEDWGYSQSGLDEVFVRCPRSCGRCPRVTDSAKCLEQQCTAPVISDSCRPCSGKVPGVDIMGDPMRCPGDAIPTTTGLGSESGSSDDGLSPLILVVIAVGILGALACLAYLFCRSKAKAGGTVGTKPSSSSRSVAVEPATIPAKATPLTGAAASICPRPAPPADGGGDGSAMGKVMSVPKKAPMLPIPRLWLNKASELETMRDLPSSMPPRPVPSKAFFTTETAPELIEVFQKLLDSTWAQITTRDRGSRPVPKGLRVASVQRIENSELWQRYSNGHAAVTNKRSHRCTQLSNLSGGMVKTLTDGSLKEAGIAEQLDDRVNEVYLFHGTSPAGALGIAQGGFNLNYAGSAAGSMYGPGVYMAEMSSKSDEYAKDAEDGLYKGLCCLLLCRAVLGEMLTLTAGGESVHPVVKAAMESGIYDSVLGDRQASVGTYREFVAYNDHQVYPEYLILYSRVAG